MDQRSDWIPTDLVDLDYQRQHQNRPHHRFHHKNTSNSNKVPPRPQPPQQESHFYTRAQSWDPSKFVKRAVERMYVSESSQMTSNHGSSASISGPFYGLGQPPHSLHQQSRSATHQQFAPRRRAYYESHWPLYGIDWGCSSRGDIELVAVSTFSEDSNNRLQVLQATKVLDSSNQTTVDLQHTAESIVTYPVTKLGWEPRGTSGNSTSVKMVSTADCLRLWEYDVENCKLHQRSSLVNKSKSEYMPPLTSFDWNKVNPALVITSSIDTTCTIWDISTSTAKTQLIAHDSEVYDVAFTAKSVDLFTSVGADGSVRVFDLRSLEHSTIIYEPAHPQPLVRLAASPYDDQILATVEDNSSKIIVLDIRQPGVPLVTLEGHHKAVNAIRWMDPSTNNNGHPVLASAGDDGNVLLWDLAASTTAAGLTPVSVYTDVSEVNNLAWSPNGDYIGTVSGRAVQGIKI